MLREAAVYGPPGEVGRVTEVLPLTLAERATTAGPVKPCDPDPLTDLPIGDAGTERLDDAHHLMSRDDGRALYVEVPLDDVQVGPTHPTRVHLDPHFISGGLRNRDVFEAQRVGLDGSWGV